MGEIVFNWILVLIYMGVIFFFSSQSSLPQVVTSFNDKILHTVEYALLGLLFIRATTYTRPRWAFKTLLMLTVCFCLLYGFSDEFHQSFVPGRDASGYDVLADGIGGLLGAFVWRIRCHLK